MLSAKGDVAMALSVYFESGLHENSVPSAAASSPRGPAPEASRESVSQGPRTLTGAPAPPSAPWPSASAGTPSTARPRAGGIMTFRDLRSDAEVPEARDGEDPVNLYTGGERSGLSVENPRQRDDAGHGLVNDILSQASQSSHRPPRDTRPASSSAFSGKGYSINGTTVDDESHPSGDPTDGDVSDEEPAVRHLTFWADGFSIGDGPLMRYDDPGNQEVLEAIHAGRAPLHLLDVRFGQPVELVVSRRTNEKYVPPPPPPAKPFEGVGNRLGAPSVVPAPPNQAPNVAPPTPASIQADPSQPMTQIQVRLPNGQRLIAKLNLSHTVADLRTYILSYVFSMD